VHLHQIDRFGLQTRERTLHRIDPSLFTTVQTLVARKKGNRRSLSFVRRSPMTCLGATIHRRRINNAAAEFHEVRRTSAKGADCAGSTSNVCHVPSPITGSFSPEEGNWTHDRVVGGLPAPLPLFREKHNAAAVPPSKARGFAAVRSPAADPKMNCRTFWRKAIATGPAGAWARHRLRRQDLLISNQTCRDYGRHDN